MFLLVGVLLMRGVVPTEITYMDTEDIQIRYTYLRIIMIHIFNLHLLYLEIIKIHIFKSIFRFTISSLGLPNFSFSETLKGSVGETYRQG
jgi:hypothetical protein